MNPLRNFEEFLKEGVANKQRVDLSRASSLAEEAEKRKAFLKEMSDKIGVNDENANYFIENAYDILTELVRARMFIEGLKSSGVSAHEAEISYMRNLGFSESEVRFANELRYFRNGIIYYGKRLNAEYAGAVLDFLNKAYPKLLRLARPRK